MRLERNPELASNLTAHLLDVAHSDATTVIGGANLPANARNARFVSLTNTRDLRINEVWAASDGSAILDVALTADCSQEFEARLPDPAAPPGLFTWTQMTQRSTIVLTFEVLQHADTTERFAARLTGWQDVRDVLSAST